jgi:hypothetical protein
MLMISMVSGSIHILKTNTKALEVAMKEIGLAVNAENVK